MLGILGFVLVLVAPTRAGGEEAAPENRPEEQQHQEPQEPAASPIAPEMPPPRNVARVVIRSTQQVTLVQRRAGTREWITACESPCEKDLPLDDEYRVTGSGLRSSNEFKLEASAGQTVELHVRPSTKFTWELGVIVGGTGFLIDVVAVYLLVVSLAVKVGDCTANGAFVSVVAQGVCRDKPPPEVLAAISLIALVPGTVAAVAGIATATSAWSTRLTQEVARPTSSAFRRFSETPERGQLGAPSFVSLPFASGRF